MPFPFQVILLSGATGFVLTAVLFVIARGMPRTEPGAGWWALSSLAAGVGYVALLAFSMGGEPARGEALYNMLFALWATALYLGGRRFLGLSVRPLRWLLGLALLSAWLGYFYFIEYHFLAAAVAIAGYCGALNLRLGWLMRRPGNRLHLVLTALLWVSGLHWLDYPLLRPVESFAPIGFSICAIVSVLVNGTLAALVLSQFRSRVLASEQAAIHAASHDPLTGLSNRLALDTLFEQAAARSERDGRPMAVLFLDLDGFKPINDQLGHEAGDQLLVNIAQRLRALTRKSDVVARIGGDEFLLLLADLGQHGEDGAQKVAGELLTVIAEPMILDGQRCAVSASIGISHYPRDGRTLNHLMLAADKAMYAAKKGGKCGFRVA